MKRLRSILPGAVSIGLLSCAWDSEVAIAASTQTLTVESRAITVRIDRANWNQWAFGLGKNIRHSQDGWIADSGSAVAKVQFTPRNSFGIVDHTVIRPSGERVYVPMRLITNGSGCELIFTLFREPKMSDAQFASDSGYVQRDLNGLKTLLER
jgi:hypothetical protein